MNIYCLMFGAYDVKRLDAIHVRMGSHISPLCQGCVVCAETHNGPILS